MTRTPAIPRLRLAALLVAALGAMPASAGAQGAPATGPAACVPRDSSDLDRATGVATPLAARAPDATSATVRILASVTAAEVRFTGSPKICVRLAGDVQLDTVRVTARRNIASPVVSNTTYRDVYVAMEIVGRLNAECIAGRITGVRPDSSLTRRCASLGVQGDGGARRSPP